MCLGLLLAAALASPPSPAVAQDGKGAPAAWSPALPLKVKTVGPVRVPPDGRRVAYGVTPPVMTADRGELVT